VLLRKELLEQGFDCGTHTIHYHLSLSDPSLPSVSTIWRAPSMWQALTTRCLEGTPIR
jgi:hypothetical protein